ncbi:MAG: NAD(P)H-dependent oxidoreductase subunit E, partial [Synergistaceae bacterium]|nr:NAD(P)H-dependent oxidoreductase subunit E [Synergistaceae bacterium]
MLVKEEVVSRTQEIVAPWKGRKGALIPILQETQSVFGYLPA